MSINFLVTEAGRLAMLDAQQKRIKLSLFTVGLGDGRYNPTGTETGLQSLFAENGMSAGGVETESNLIRFTVIMNHSAEREVSEIGLFTSDGVLFALAASSDGAFFKLYPSIDFVATMGLSLKNVANPSDIDLIINDDGGLATEIMAAHLSEANPHPQYIAYMNSAMTEHLDSPDPHPQYALKTFVDNEVKIIEGKIDRLYQLTQYLFPPLMRAEYGGESLKINRNLGVSYSLASRGMVALVCPENQHEGWTVEREENAVTVLTQNRSGVNRIGYTGRVNALLIDTDRVLEKEGFLDKTNQLAYEIKSGVFQSGDVLEILKAEGEQLDYTSDDVVVLISPEGQHEGWTVTRSEQKLKFDVLGRSGTSRVPYAGGRVSWMLLKANSTPLPRDQYPFNLMSGVSGSGSFMIPSPDGLDFSQSNFMPMISPESQHEGWEVTRTNAGFKVDVFNRSGTNRVGYTGKVSWAVFMTSQSSVRTVFEVGTHKFTFKAGAAYRITIVAGGGAGGNAIRYHSGATPIASETGQDTVLDVGGLIVTAHGGEGGVRGCWNNGSAYRDGTSGIGGDVEYSNNNTAIQSLSVQAEMGTSGKMAQYNVGEGGSSYYGLEFERGAGGKGKSGSGSRNLGFGGSGGGAGSALVAFSVGGESDLQAQITVGAGGKYYDDPEEYYQSNWNFGFGEIGQAGIVIIDEFAN